MDKDKESKKKEEKKLGDLTPEKDAKGGANIKPIGPPLHEPLPNTRPRPTIAQE